MLAFMAVLQPYQQVHQPNYNSILRTLLHGQTLLLNSTSRLRGSAMSRRWSGNFAISPGAYLSCRERPEPVLALPDERF
jgi:hypothetical protein